MRQFSLRIGIAVLTFLVGVSSAYVCLIGRNTEQINPSLASSGQPVANRSLLCAASKADVATVTKLLDAGVKTDETHDNGDCDGQLNRPIMPFPGHITPLMRAAGLGHLDVVRLLLARGANVNARDSDGNTPLSGAAYYMHADVVDILLEKGADINTADEHRQTILMNAAGNGANDTVRYLLGRGADPNLQDQNGTTALMFAAGFKHPEIMQLLLEKGANPNLADHRGRRASSYRRFGYPKEYIIVIK